MYINVSDPVTQTLVVVIGLVIALILSIRKEGNPGILTLQHSAEAKGLAILLVIFGHIGYLLSRSHTFLAPLSGSAGVGVDIFLILSGYGLAYSALKNDLSPLEFYKKRFLKIFVPMWVVITIFLVLERVVKGLGYSLTSIIQSYLGFFPNSNPFVALDSPLWYFTLITFYYLIFPFAFWRKLRYLSPLIFVGLGYLMLKLPLPIDAGIWNLYSLHYWGFSVGIVLAFIFNRLPKDLKLTGTVKIIGTALFAGFILYNYFFPHVGRGRETEQLFSLVTALAYLGFITLKGFRVELLRILGEFSYETYLIHWPILWRYDLIYTALPAGMATILYVAIFTGLGAVIQRITSFLSLVWQTPRIKA